MYDMLLWLLNNELNFRFKTDGSLKNISLDYNSSLFFFLKN